jgi:hypothetical protein
LGITQSLKGDKGTQRHTAQDFETIEGTKKIESHRVAPPINMFPEFYQTTLRAHLSETQYLTLHLLLLLLQAHRQVKLSVLASVFPQPIQYQSRKRNLQRFLALPKLASIIVSATEGASRPSEELAKTWGHTGL